MYIIIILLIFITILVIFFIFKNKKANQYDNRFKSFNVQKKDSQTVINKLVDRISKDIDLEKNIPFVKPSIIKEKCIRAGIRDTDKHKNWVSYRFLGAIAGMLITPLMLYLVSNYDSPQMLGLVSVGGLILGFFYPIIRLDSMIENRQIEINNAFPDFVDLTLVCVEAGMSAEQTYARTIDDLKKFSIAMADEIQLLSAEITYFLSPKIAYDNFFYRTNSDFVKAYCGVVLQSLQFGTPLGQGLRTLSTEIREAQMGIIERKAAALPSKLTVPMMLFTLPVLMTYIMYPAISQVLIDYPK
jgi:tight adherence protein C